MRSVLHLLIALPALALSEPCPVIPAPARVDPLPGFWPGAGTGSIESCTRILREGDASTYVLAVAEDGIVIRAGSDEALHHARQTLWWLMDAADGKPIPAVRIEDAPRFRWRGLMLDESRHFFGKEEVKRLLDVMSLLKMNIFHWHLTDEPAWRIEILKWPRLTTVGATGSWSDRTRPAAFYTQADIREIVRYAADRHIIIVPEIDLPGHANAATRAYPEFGAPGEGRWNGFTFHPAREGTYRFLEDVLTEVAGLFPGPWIHIGGDEVHYGNQSWTNDPEIIAHTRDQGFRSALELEHAFVRRMATFVQQKLGKTVVGWDEITQAGLDPARSVAMWWHHEKPQVLATAIERRFGVVLTPRHPCYFDFVQHESHQSGRRWDGFNPLERVYAFPDPVKDALARALPDQVLGIEACVWSERIDTPERMAYMTYPRLAALAEAAWSPHGRKDFDSFQQRLPRLLRELDRRKIRYFNVFDPASTPEPIGPSKPDVLADG